METRFTRGRALSRPPSWVFWRLSISWWLAMSSGLAMVAGLLIPLAGRAGPVNPDISVIGQPFARITDDPEDADRERLQFDVGEVELVLEGYLNPYAKGFFTLAIGEEGLDLEEGYLDLLRGLPFGLALRGGQYRVGFGRQNPVHPHAYPFAERFRVLAAYLPGEEAFVETGISLSKLMALPGDRSLTVAADLLQGDSFRIEREPGKSPNDPLADPEGPGDHAAETRLAFAARASVFAPIGEESGIDLGVSVTHGTTNVAAEARSTVAGIDGKAKLWRAPDAYLLLQGEGLWMDRPDDRMGGRAGVRRIAGGRLRGLCLRRLPLGAALQRRPRRRAIRGSSRRRHRRQLGGAALHRLVACSRNRRPSSSIGSASFPPRAPR